MLKFLFVHFHVLRNTMYLVCIIKKNYPYVIDNDSKVIMNSFVHKVLLNSIISFSFVLSFSLAALFEVIGVSLYLIY